MSNNTYSNDLLIHQLRSELESKIKACERYETFQKCNDEMIKTMEKKYEICMEENSKLKKEIVEKNEVNNQLLDKYKSISHESIQLEKEKDMEIEYLNQKLINTKQEFNNEIKSYQEIHGTSKDINNEIQWLKHQKLDLENRFKLLNKEYESIQNEKRELFLQNKNLREENANSIHLKHEISSLKGELIKCNTKMENYKNIIHSLNTEIIIERKKNIDNVSKLDTDMKENKIDIDNMNKLKKEMEELKQKNEYLSIKYYEAKKEIVKISNDHKNEIDSLHNELLNKKCMVQTLEKKNDDLNKEMIKENIKNNIETNEYKNKINEKIDMLQTSQSYLKERLKLLDNNNNSIDEAKRIREKYNLLATDYNLMIDRFKELQEKEKNIQQKYNELKSIFDIKCTDMTTTYSLKNENDALKYKVEKIKKDEQKWKLQAQVAQDLLIKDRKSQLDKENQNQENVSLKQCGIKRTIQDDDALLYNINYNRSSQINRNQTSQRNEIMNNDHNKLFNSTKKSRKYNEI